MLLAGDRPDEADLVARHAGVSCKAFTPVAGRPMVERALAALRDAPRVGRIEVALAARDTLAVEAPGLARWLDDGSVQRLDPASSPAGTVAAALADLLPGQSLLVTTADHALLSRAILDQFLERVDAAADGCAGLLALDTLEARYPDVQRTALRLRDGRYAGCNLFLLRTGPGARSLIAFWQRLESLRKSPWRMARAVGPLPLALYVLRLMTLRGALARLGRAAGARLAPVILDIPEAAIDVDTPADLAFVERLLDTPRPVKRSI